MCPPRLIRSRQPPRDVTPPSAPPHKTSGPCAANGATCTTPAPPPPPRFAGNGSGNGGASTARSTATTARGSASSHCEKVSSLLACFQCMNRRADPRCLPCENYDSFPPAQRNLKKPAPNISTSCTLPAKKPPVSTHWPICCSIPKL